MGCTDLDTHGYTSRLVFPTRGQAWVTLAEMTSAQADAARAERRDVIESNKARSSAVIVRRACVKTLLARRTAPKGTAALVAAALAQDADVVTRRGGNDLVGCERAVYGRSPGSSPVTWCVAVPRDPLMCQALSVMAVTSCSGVGVVRERVRTSMPR